MRQAWFRGGVLILAGSKPGAPGPTSTKMVYYSSPNMLPKMCVNLRKYYATPLCQGLHEGTSCSQRQKASSNPFIGAALDVRWGWATRKSDYFALTAAHITKQLKEFQIYACLVMLGLTSLKT